jgi:hypothetical protein
MPSPRHTLASLVEKNLPFDKAHKVIGADGGFKSIIENNKSILISTPEETQISQENDSQSDEESKVVELQINQDESVTQEEIVESSKERKQRHKKEKEETKKS